MRVWVMVVAMVASATLAACIVVLVVAISAWGTNDDEVSTPQVPAESLECRQAMARAEQIRVEIQTQERICSGGIPGASIRQSHACGRVRALELEHAEAVAEIAAYCH